MGAHHWVLGPIITLMLAVASARPPKCEQPPLWSIDGRQPLVESKGNVTVLALLQASWQFCLLQARSLEFLQRHFSDHGMDDINFMIVNSKLQHAVLLRRELENRVSFEVFQDNSEVDVWNKMEGGKDDVYIYDRCGRLAYFIPYPLSVMASADSLVPKAILATYLRSPCGDTCEGNSSFADNETMDYSNNATSNSGMEQDVAHSHHLNTSNNISINDSDPSRNNIVNLFFNTSSNNSSTETLNNSHTIESNQTTLNDSSSQIVPARNDRCLEADIQVCRDYSKRRLLRIQSCCLSENNEALGCRSFTPRRCKKMQTVIKCCIKTTISDPTTAANTDEFETTVATAVHEEVETSTHSDNGMHTGASMWQNAPWQPGSGPPSGPDSQRPSESSLWENAPWQPESGPPSSPDSQRQSASSLWENVPWQPGSEPPNGPDSQRPSESSLWENAPWQSESGQPSSPDSQKPSESSLWENAPWQNESGLPHSPDSQGGSESNMWENAPWHQH